jgi:HK97 family phage portal protein
MSIFQKVFDLFKKKSSGENAFFFDAIGSLYSYYPGKKVSVDRAMAVYNGWVYACIRAIAEGIASIDFRLISIGKDGTEQEIFDHELLDILNAPNPYQTGYELKYKIAAHLEQTGNAYLFLDGVKNQNQKPTGIYILNPKYVKVEISGNNLVYKYSRGGETKTYEPFEIIHIKYPDPDDDLYGIGTVQAIAQWIDADTYATEYNRSFFENSARPDSILKSESAVSPEQLKILKKSFEELYGGVKKAHKVIALPKGTDFQPINWNFKDMDFQNLQVMMRDKILAGFRVPKTILGTAESDTNRATAETAKYVFAERTLKPKMSLITISLNEFLVPRYGENIYLDFKDPVPENEELERQKKQAALGNAPWMSVNEVRELEGLPPIEGGDYVMSPFNLTALGKPIEKKQNYGVRAKIQTRYAINNKKREKMISEIKEKTEKEIKELLEKIEKEAKVENADMPKDITKLSDEEFEEKVYKRFFVRVSEYEKKLKEKIREHNKQEKEKVVANLGKITKDINPNDLLDKDEQVQIIIDLVKPIQNDLFVNEAREAANLIGVGGFILTPEIQRAIDDSVKLLANTYEETTLELLKVKLSEGIERGLGIDELASIVKEIYDFSDEVRAETVARTEVFRIANSANHEVWKQSGVVKTIKWYTAVDERVCPFCSQLHGKTISVEETFFEKGDEVEGTDGTRMTLDYTDVAYPPLHPSCRCYIRPEELNELS